jgi:excinuclease ABC subunit C
MKTTLKEKLSVLPDKAGIYFFKNTNGEIIYIGKARSLRDRVRSYFLPSPDFKVTNIISETADIDFILTGSEREAAFLENNFIQRYQPKFNLRLKDDKSFPYLKLTLAENFPGVSLTRKVEPDGSRYFGPFSPASQARKTIHLLNRYFGIRSCGESIPGARRRPCLEYDLKLCSAPCVDYVTEREYRENVDNALLFLEGKTKRLLNILKEKMNQSAGRQDYEQAAHWRDLIRTIEQVRERPKVISVSLENRDIFGLAREGDRAFVYIFFMRRGKVREAEDMVLREAGTVPAGEILSRVLESFYEKSGDIPGRILVPALPSSAGELEDRLSLVAGRKIRISAPKRGKDRQLVEMANRNAEILLKKKLEEVPASLEELARLIGLPAPPLRIEGFDISNTGGEESVGSLVVFEKGKPKSSEYRKYRIKTVAGPNDVASLEEVVRRRYSRILQESQELPGLVVVDGGKGQLHAAQTALRALGLGDLPLVSLAKKQEIVFSRHAREGLHLDRTSPALKLLQFIRDEAHRFAISFHRQRREKKSFASDLAGIPGLGEKRRKALLSRYGSLEEIRAAPLDELSDLIGRAAASKLKEGTHDHGHRD